MKTTVGLVSFRTIWITVLIGILITSSCEKPERLIKITTLEAVDADISYTSAKLHGEVTDLGSRPVDDHGILVSENASPRIETSKIASLGSLTVKGSFQAEFTTLEKNKLYYFRAYVTVDGEDIYAAKIFSFRTKDTQSPSVTAGSVTELTMTTARVSGEVTSDGGEASTIRGLCWGLTANPTISNCIDTTRNGSGKGTFTGKMEGLTQGTRYYVRAYAINPRGTTYHNAAGTPDLEIKTHALPEVTTTAVTAISNTGATSGGNVTDDGEVSILSKGVCWSTSPNPTFDLPTRTNEGTGKGVYVSTVTGLTPGTSYYIRAFAENQYGVRYGSETTFKTTKPPTASTSPATLIGNTTVTLNGTVNANGFSTTVTFEYGNTTSYGNEAPATPGSLTGSTPTSVAVNLSGLNPQTEYHFRVKAVNEGGTTYGDDATFITTDAPVPVTGSATSVNNTSLTLNGTVNPRNSSTSVSFEYGPTTSYGSTITATPSPVNGNSSVAVSASISGLSPGQLLHYRLKAISTGGLAYGDDMITKTTQPPASTTSAANEISISSATLNGSVTPYDLQTTVTFEYGPTTAYGTSVTASQSPVNGADPVAVSAVISGLTTGNLYHFRVKAENSGGTTYGNDNTFTTLQPPLATTGSASLIANNSATLNGSVNANNSVTTVSFEYGLTTSYGTTINGTPSSVTGNTNTPVSASLTGLEDGKTYHFRIKASSAGGAVTGSDQEFTTLKAPDITPSATTSITSTGATLNGTVNANGLSSVVTFEYGPTTAYGTSVTAIQSPVTGSINTTVSYILTGLVPSSTYHFRIKGVSTGGTSYSGDQSFSTAAAPPTVSDFDANVYNVIQTGTQEWMQSNLKTTHYNNGDLIPEITNGTTWSTLTTGAMVYYNNDPALYKNVYGGLYNWKAVTDVRNICPAGWHVPSDQEFNALITELGGYGTAGGKLKESGTSHWLTPNSSADNTSGFTGLPGGHRLENGSFANLGTDGYWWTSTPNDEAYSWRYGLEHDGAGVGHFTYQKTGGFSVRCLKGEMPLTETRAATSATATSITLNGKVNPNTGTTSVSFEYGTTTSYGSTITALQSPLTGSISGNVNGTINSLLPGTEYHYRVTATNSGGISYGSDMTFLTLNPPSATTSTAANITPTSSTLRGVVNPNNYSTTVAFEYGPTTAYGTSVNASESPLTGTADQQVSASVTGLSQQTTYHYRVVAANSGGTVYGADQVFTTSEILPTVFDYDGNEYNTVKIGNQLWMSENLKTIHLNSGIAIPLVTSSPLWQALTGPGFCYESNNESNKDIYGALYNWYVGSDPLNSPCPTGWHVPLEIDFNILASLLGGSPTAGGKMKVAGLSYWNTPNTAADNSSGFSGRGGGIRAYNGTFGYFKNYGAFWTASPASLFSGPPSAYLTYNDAILSMVQSAEKTRGHSIRCLIGEAITETSTSVTTNSATIHGLVNPNSLSTMVTFEYGLTSNYGQSVTAAQSPVNGSSRVSVSANLTGLTPARKYHYRIKAVNGETTTYGGDKTFITDAEFPLSPGDYYAGGIVFYVDGSGQHGMAAAEYNAANGTAWVPPAYYDVSVPGTSVSFGSGDENTIAIVTLAGVGSYPASLCSDFQSGGYSDWFLPSRDELNLMYQNLNLNGWGNFENRSYWSSSQGTTYQFAHYQRFDVGAMGEASKTSGTCVFSCIATRAVRIF